MSRHHPNPPKRAMDHFLAVGLAEGFMEPEGEDEVIEAWQYLHDTGLAYRLQGWFGRTARDMLKAGTISDTKNAGGS